MGAQAGREVEVVRRRETVLVTDLIDARQADLGMVAGLASARYAVEQGRSRLDSVQCEIDDAVAAQGALALDTTAGVLAFQRFLADKRRDILTVVTQARLDGRQRATDLGALCDGYDTGSTLSTGDPELPVSSAVWELIRKSPTLMAQWRQLKAEGWTITFEPGVGSWTGSKQINIAPQLKGRPALLVQTLAHELGHATSRRTVDKSSKADCVNGLPEGEGVATMNTFVVQREILSNDGPNIVMPGSGADRFEKYYDDYLRAGSTPTAYERAISVIGSEFRELVPSSDPDSTYEEYYGQSCPTR